MVRPPPPRDDGELIDEFADLFEVEALVDGRCEGVVEGRVDADAPLLGRLAPVEARFDGEVPAEGRVDAPVPDEGRLPVLGRVDALGRCDALLAFL